MADLSEKSGRVEVEIGEFKVHAPSLHNNLQR